MTAPTSLNQDLIAKTPPRPHLSYLDGLRGLAALWVVLYHFVGFNVPALHTAAARTALGFLVHGQLAVSIFIVLSGYVLMLPVSQSRDGTFRGGLKRFALKRARRIVPAYWAALVFAIALQLFSSDGKALLHGHTSPELATNLSPASVTLHALLLHNLTNATNKSISGPFWSVAAEWDIYAIFALVLLPVWRRFGRISAVLLAFVLGFAPLCLLAPTANFAWTSPWFIGLFALGMATADHNFGLPSRRTSHAPMAALLATVVLCETAWLSLHHDLIWLPDLESVMNFGRLAPSRISYDYSQALSQ